MRIKLLIATTDNDYAEHLSNILSEKYMDTFEVTVCSSAERLQPLLAGSRFDAALLEPGLAASVSLSAVSLPLLLIDESGMVPDSEAKSIRKYQRISSLAGTVLEHYAEISQGISGLHSGRARITAVWSPAGGTGKTSVALAYATHQASRGKQALYLSLENFSSTSVYFPEGGKSISKAFEKLESNLPMLLAGIRQQDSGSGVFYFCGPENYDDIHILTTEDIEILVGACSTGMDDLIIDLSSQCDQRTRRIFDLADSILFVCDPSAASQAKLRQFIQQHNIFGQIQSKSVLVCNKGAAMAETGISKTVSLPLVRATDPGSVFKALSSGKFEG